jgi:thiamine pyrophosphate-dependent acetolactate synthase large subunit-like protein
MLSSETAGILGVLSLVKLHLPDLVILLGARTGMYLGGRSGAIIPDRDCKVMQVDCDGSEIGRTLPIELGIVSDVEAFVNALSTELESPYPIDIDNKWVRSVLGLSSQDSPFDNEPEETDSGNLHPHHAVKHLVSAIEPGSIIVLDGGEASLWVGGLAARSQPSLVMTATGYLGFLGNGFGYSLGCAIAAPERKVINIQGDGSAGFHLMELDTYKRFNLNIMTIIMNNSCWGMSINGQDLVYGTENPARPVSSLSSGTEYDIVGKGLQNSTAKVSRLSDIESTVTRLQASPGPSCINLIVDRKPTHPLTTMMVGLTDNPDSVVVPYYDNIPRAYYKS